jgi:hypothetical protein
MPRRFRTLTRSRLTLAVAAVAALVGVAVVVRPSPTPPPADGPEPGPEPGPALPIGESRVWVVMAGADRGGRAVFVDRLDAMGLLPLVDFALQVSGDKDRFPEDFGSASAMRDDAYARSTRRLASAWAPEPFVHVYYDHEPARTRPDGTREQWMLRMGNTPLNADDADFVRESLAGLRDAIADAPPGTVRPGSPVGMYYLPRHPRFGEWKPRHTESADAFVGELSGEQEVVQLNGYWTPRSDAEPFAVTLERLTTAAAYARAAGGEPVLMLHPHWDGDNGPWFKRHLAIAHGLGVRVLVWVKASDPWHADAYADELEPLAPMLRRFAVGGGRG